MTEPPPRHRLPAWVLYAAFGIVLVWAALYRIPFTIDVARIAWNPEAVAGAPFSVEWPVQTIVAVSPGLSDPPLHVRDRVVSVDGTPYRYRPHLDRAVAAKGPGKTLEVVVERRAEDGRIETIPSTVRLAPPSDLGKAAFRVLLIVLGIFMPWLCFALGFWVVLARPRDPMAWLVLLLLLGLSHATGTQQNLHYAWSDPLRILGGLYRGFFGNTWTLWLPLFGIYFAERLDVERRFPWVKWLLLGPLAVIAARDVAITLAASLDARAVQPFMDATDGWRSVELPLSITAVGLFFFVMGWKSQVTTSADAKRRIRLLVWGGAAAFSPMLALIIVSQVTKRDVDDLPAMLVVPCLLALAVFPITLAYVILVDRAMDVRVAIRQGLRYGATRGAIRVLVLVMMIGVIWTAYRLVSNPDANRPVRLMAISFGMVAVLLVPQGARRLFAWTDRRFFREAYDAERVLTGLSEEVRTIVDMDTLLDTVLERIGSTLHVDRLGVYLREGEGFVPSRSVGYGRLPELGVPPIVENIRAVAASGRAIRVRHDDPESPLRRGALREEVRALLDELGAELVLPLLGKREVLGFITLGAKKSEEPYSASDAKLLAWVGVQTGLALENSRLSATIVQEVARRERMSREIEIARDVQLKLFPQRIPSLAGVDCAGACRPAQGVGGDYYDFLALSGGKLGIALGDVAGKGIPAALLMASLQASLRGQRLSGPSDLAQMMTNMNRLIFDSSPDNRYATFFYGELDPVSRRLDYVNAGHNAPMIFRRSGAVDRLRATGSVIGLVDGGRYEQASTTLESGDLLVVYSDGISEALNPEDEEWGETRLSAAVMLERHGKAETLISHLFESADAFASGAVQNDDMTLVVVRVD